MIICLTCGVSRKREEDFFDLRLDVKGLKGVNESLCKYFGYETFDDDNKLTCDACEEKMPS